MGAERELRVAQVPQPDDAEPSLVSALGRTIEAGQHLVIDRIELARLDALEAIERTQWSALLIMLGAMMALSGWIGIGTAAIVLLQQYLSLTLPVSAALVGVVTMALGGGLAAAGLQYGKTAVAKDGVTDKKHAPRRWEVGHEYDRV